MPAGNKSFIHRAMRNAETEVDFDEKATVQRTMSRVFGIPALMDEVLFISKFGGNLVALDQSKFSSKEDIYNLYFVHSPDLLVKVFNFPMVIEIDGPVHWENTKAMKNTNARNCHYEQAGIKMLWLTKKDAQSAELVDIIHTRLSALLGFEPLRL